MKLNQLLKTQQFLNNFKENYSHLRIGKNMSWDSDMFDKNEYSMTIRTESKVIGSEQLNNIAAYLNHNKLFWFIGTGTKGNITFHIQ